MGDDELRWWHVRGWRWLLPMAPALLAFSAAVLLTLEARRELGVAWAVERESWRREERLQGLLREERQALVKEKRQEELIEERLQNLGWESSAAHMLAEAWIQEHKLRDHEMIHGKYPRRMPKADD